MNTQEVNTRLFQNPVTRRHFLGTYPSCMIPETSKKFYTFITNTQNHDESGEHWNGWVVDRSNVTFFDSFGRSPHSLGYNDIVKNFRQVRYTTKCVQDFKSQTCGLFCIHFLYVMSLKLPIDLFFSEYSIDLKNNDYVVSTIVESM